MENKLEKKYGLLMAICMVIGIVIGSGIFFKAQDILVYTGGNILYGVLAWLIGGVVMIICALTFAKFASKFEKVNGIVDYAEAIVGPKYAYFVGWFIAIIYFPAMTAVLAWVSARYTLSLFGNPNLNSGLCMTLAGVYLVASYALNALSPKLSGKFHVSATTIKLIPILIMVLVGSVVGIFNDNLSSAFSLVTTSSADSGSIFSSIVAAAFAYEGWIIATSINSEIKDSKRNLPIALTVGSIIIMAIYLTYFIALAGGASIETLMIKGAPQAFINLFGNIGGTILNAFIVISCLGTLNGLMLATTRSMYSIAIRNKGPKPEVLSQVDKVTNMPNNSAVVAVLVCSLWLFHFFGANLIETPIFGYFNFDSSELPIITTYAIYLPIFITYIVKEIKSKNYREIILPILGTLSSLFMIGCAFYAHGVKPLLNGLESNTFTFPILFYLILFGVIMIVGLLFSKQKDSK